MNNNIEFKSLNNIKSAISILKTTVIIVVIACALTTTASVFWAFNYAENQRQKIYVLDDGKSLILGLAQDVNMNQEDLMNQAVRSFHEYFFTFNPSKESIEYHSNRALRLADKSAHNLFNRLVESQYYNEMVSARASQEIRIDSIVLNMNVTPIQAMTFGKTYISRTSNITQRSIITKCNIRMTPRDSENPFGYMLEKIEIIDNSDIATYEK